MITLSNKARKSRGTGFTLVELLVVVLILGILVAVAIPLYLSSVKNSSTRTVQANMKTIAQAAQAYRVRVGNYPADLPTMVGPAQDLQQRPAGPSGVLYEVEPIASGASVQVTATEAGTDVFGGGNGTTDVATYNLQTGVFNGLNP